MKIEGDAFYDVELFVSGRNALHCSQRKNGPIDIDKIVVDKQQAAQLIEVLQRWVNGEEIE